jgi:hypothetical protein
LVALAIPAPAGAESGEGRIAFVSTYSGDADIITATLDATDVVQLMETPGIDETSPTWSPDGSQPGDRVDPDHCSSGGEEHQPTDHCQQVPAHARIYAVVAPDRIRDAGIGSGCTTLRAPMCASKSRGGCGA